MATTIHALNASLTDLRLALCPWANWAGTVAAVKLNTQLDLRGPRPAFVSVTAADCAEALLLDGLPIEAGSFYRIDRGHAACGNPGYAERRDMPHRGPDLL